MRLKSRVAVIGAGVAGLSCANVLRSAGVDVLVLDKSRGVAGRMSTRRGDGWQCDHGAQYFTARHPDFQAEVAQWCAAGAAAPWRARLAAVGGDGGHQPDGGLERFVGVPRMTAPARLMAEEHDVRLEQTVTGLRRDEAGWCITTRESGDAVGRYAAVVIAVPAPQAVPLLQPCAVDMAELAAEVRMQGSWAVMLRFAAPVDLPFDAAFVNQGPLRWVARDSSKPGRDGTETWLLHATAEWSEEHIEDAPESVAEVLIAAFAALGAPSPAAWSAHRWRYADSAPALGINHVWNAAAGLGLCGDWLNGGKVEGAWLSGRDLGLQVVRALA